MEMPAGRGEGHLARFPEYFPRMSSSVRGLCSWEASLLLATDKQDDPAAGGKSRCDSSEQTKGPVRINNESDQLLKAFNVED